MVFQSRRFSAIPASAGSAEDLCSAFHAAKRGSTPSAAASPTPSSRTSPRQQSVLAAHRHRHARAALQLRHLEHARAGAPDGDAGGAIRAERPAPAYSRSNARCGMAGSRRPGGAVRTSARLSYPGRRVRLAGFTRSANANTLSANCSRRPSSNASASDPNTRTRRPRRARRRPARAPRPQRGTPARLMRATVARDASKARPAVQRRLERHQIVPGRARAAHVLTAAAG